jgi:hypothetical protein
MRSPQIREGERRRPRRAEGQRCADGLTALWFRCELRRRGADGVGSRCRSHGIAIAGNVENAAIAGSGNFKQPRARWGGSRDILKRILTPAGRPRRCLHKRERRSNLAGPPGTPSVYKVLIALKLNAVDYAGHRSGMRILRYRERSQGNKN